MVRGGAGGEVVRVGEAGGEVVGTFPGVTEVRSAHVLSPSCCAWSSSSSSDVHSSSENSNSSSLPTIIGSSTSNSSSSKTSRADRQALLARGSMSECNRDSALNVSCSLYTTV